MYYIGIDLGGTNIAAGITDEKGRIIRKDSIPTRKEREYPEVIKDMAAIALKVAQDAGVPLSQVKSIGIGAPGTPDTKNGRIIYANNLKFRNAPVRDEMHKYTDLPIYIDNDANCAALAESVAGAAKGAANSITITLGTGLGGGIVINRRIYSGFNDAGGELGHMVIVVDGVQCTCGRKGCWEAYASATGLIAMAVKAMKENPDSLMNDLTGGGNPDKMDAKIPFDAARQGDATGVRVVGEYIKYLGEGLINIINIFQPDVLVIGGGICKEGEFLLKPLKERIASGVYSRPEVSQTAIRTAEMGNDAGIIGAAMLGLQEA
ncbi:MAG: ROK family protein [Eubacteriales bacterium]|nr:ROK family protein [Eubacteriales bacterium]